MVLLQTLDTDPLGRYFRKIGGCARKATEEFGDVIRALRLLYEDELAPDGSGLEASHMLRAGLP